MTKRMLKTNLCVLKPALAFEIPFQNQHVQGVSQAVPLEGVSKHSGMSLLCGLYIFCGQFGSCSEVYDARLPPGSLFQKLCDAGMWYLTAAPLQDTLHPKRFTQVMF